jgi:molybdate transport system substrate-binding protein
MVSRSALIVAGIALTAAAVGGVAGGCQEKSKSSNAEVRVFVAAGLAEAMTELSPKLDAELAAAGSNSAVFDFAGTGELLGKLKVVSAPAEAGHRPDIFIAAEATFARDAERLGLVDRVQPLTCQRPVLAVCTGSTAGVRSLADLARADVKVALGIATGPAIGVVSDRLLADAGLAAVRTKANTVSAKTVQEVANFIALGHADAGIIWNVTACQGDFRHKIRVIAIPNAPAVPVLICRVVRCPHPQLADRVIQFLTGDLASQTFARYGYEPVDRTATQPATRTDW